MGKSETGATVSGTQVLNPVKGHIEVLMAMTLNKSHNKFIVQQVTQIKARCRSLSVYLSIYLTMMEDDILFFYLDQGNQCTDTLSNHSDGS